MGGVMTLRALGSGRVRGINASKSTNKNGRTMALGWLSHARSYWRSGVHLRAAQLKISHGEVPIKFLFYHSIELYLKAFLLSKDINVTHLCEIGHNAAHLVTEARQHGLSLDYEDVEVIAAMSDEIGRWRYFMTGAFIGPGEEALMRTCENLDKLVFNYFRRSMEVVPSVSLDDEL
jgi:hypothetical protein